MHIFSFTSLSYGIYVLPMGIMRFFKQCSVEQTVKCSTTPPNTHCLSSVTGMIWDNYLVLNSLKKGFTMQRWQTTTGTSSTLRTLVSCTSILDQVRLQLFVALIEAQQLYMHTRWLPHAYLTNSGAISALLTTIATHLTISNQNTYAQSSVFSITDRGRDIQ